MRTWTQGADIAEILRGRIGNSQISGLGEMQKSGVAPRLEFGALGGQWSHRLRQRQQEQELVWILGLYGAPGMPK